MRGQYALPLLAALIVAGCDGNPITTPIIASTPRVALSNAADLVDVSGVWHFHEDATFVLYDYNGEHSGSKSFKCSTDGIYTFVQTGESFTGTFDQTGTCTASDGTSFPNTFAGPVAGTVRGRHVTFEPPPGECFDVGEIKGPTLSEMGGSGRCGGGGVFGTYRAVWSATRQ